MENRNWQKAFGESSETFRNQLHVTLSDLEDRDMKKRYKFTTALLAAVIAATLIVGAGFAASQLRIFESLIFDPLDGAEEMVQTDLGSVENDLVKLTVQEAVYDGNCTIVEMRIAPKEPEKYALFADMLQELSEEEYIIERVPVEFPDGKNSYITDDEGNVTPTPTYEKDGKRYYAEITSQRVVGRRDGKKLIEYWPMITLSNKSEYGYDNLGTGTLFGSMHAEEQPDGSVIVWCKDSGTDGFRPEQLEFVVSASLSVDGEKIPLDSLNIALAKVEPERVVSIAPVANGEIPGFKLIGGEIKFTRIQAYLTLNYYAYESLREDYYGYRLYDAQGNEIKLGGGGSSMEQISDDCWKMIGFREMQSLEQIPETLYLEVWKKTDGGDEVIGRIECAVTEGSPNA